MKILKLDLTIVENAVLFAENHLKYLPHTSLPKEVLDKIETFDTNYKNGLISKKELYHLILDEIIRFIKSLE